MLHALDFASALSSLTGINDFLKIPSLNYFVENNGFHKFFSSREISPLYFLFLLRVVEPALSLIVLRKEITPNRNDSWLCDDND